MSYVISTDVVCDECHWWESGATGSRIRKREAWEQAKRYGFVRIDGRMLCKDCASATTEGGTQG